MPDLNRKLSSKLIISTTVALILVLLSTSIGSAVLFDINTNDNLSTDWTSVPVLETDPSPDINTACSTPGCVVCTGAQGGTATDDIVEVKVASAPAAGPNPTHIYFMVRYAAEYLGTSPVSAPQFHWVSAYIDCPPDGPDDLDNNLVYTAADGMYLGDGNLPNFNNFTTFSPPNSLGARPSNDKFVIEWGVPLANMNQLPGGSNCKADTVTGLYPIARITFATILVNTNGQYVCTFDQVTSRLFDIPTAVELSTLETSQEGSNGYLAIVSLSALLLAILVGGFGYWYYRRSLQQGQ